MSWDIPEQKLDAEEAVKTEEKIRFNDEVVRDWVMGKDTHTSAVACGIYGVDGTAKTGIALDCRSDKEKKEGMRVFVLDLDGGSSPIKVAYHDNDPNIIIKNPIVRDQNKNIDYETTFFKIKAMIDFIEKSDDLKIKAVILDGVDKLLQICEFKMRTEMNKSASDGVDYRYWKERNISFYNIIEPIKLLTIQGIDTYFITHMKMDEKAQQQVAAWHNKFPDMLFQKIRMERRIEENKEEKTVKFVAVVEKSKTNVLLEGKEFVVLEVNHKNGKSEYEWKGLRFNKGDIIQKE